MSRAIIEKSLTVLVVAGVVKKRGREEEDEEEEEEGRDVLTPYFL